MNGKRPGRFSRPQPAQQLAVVLEARAGPRAGPACPTATARKRAGPGPSYPARVGRGHGRPLVEQAPGSGRQVALGRGRGAGRGPRVDSRRPRRRSLDAARSCWRRRAAADVGCRWRGGRRARSRRSRPGSAAAPGGTIASRRLDTRPVTAGRIPRDGRPSATAQVLVERGDAVVVEPGGDGAEHRQVLAGSRRTRSRLRATALRTSRQRVLAGGAVELVDRHGVGEVEHVDLLELRGGAELRRHHVDGHVDERDDAGVALPDAGRLDDDEVVAAPPCTRR